MLKLITLSSSSKGNCHILECNHSSIMIDCGIHFKDILSNIDVNKLQGIFISHIHKDHSKGAKDLSLYTKCSYYMNQNTACFLTIYGDRYKKTFDDNYYQLIDTGDFLIKPFDVYHDVQNTNFLILHKESGIKILYITDTSDVSNLHFKDIDFFIIEGNFSLSWNLDDMKYKRTNSEYGHLPIEDAVKFLKKNINVNTKGIFISHISHSFNKIFEFEDIVKKEVPSYITVKALNNQCVKPQEFLLKEEIEIEFN